MAGVADWTLDNAILNTGAFCFGAVVGWLTRHTLAYIKETKISSLSSVLATIGGGAVTKIFDRNSSMFAAYCVGLAIAFFLYVLLYDIDENGAVVRHVGVKSKSRNPKSVG